MVYAFEVQYVLQERELGAFSYLCKGKILPGLFVVSPAIFSTLLLMGGGIMTTINTQPIEGPCVNFAFTPISATTESVMRAPRENVTFPSMEESPYNYPGARGNNLRNVIIAKSHKSDKC